MIWLHSCFYTRACFILQVIIYLCCSVTLTVKLTERFMRKQLIDKNVGGMVDSGLIAVWIRFDKG